MTAEMISQKIEELVKEFSSAVLRRASIEAGKGGDITGKHIWLAVNYFNGRRKKKIPKGVAVNQVDSTADTALCQAESYFRGVITEKFGSTLDSILVGIRERGLFKAA